MHTINIFATTNMFEPPASNLNFKTLALGPPQSVQSLGFVGLLWRGAWRFFPILVVMDSYGSWPLFAKSSFHLGSTWVKHFNRVTWMYACMSSCAAPSLQSALPGHPSQELAMIFPSTQDNIGFITHMLHVWYIYLHLGHLWGKWW